MGFILMSLEKIWLGVLGRISIEDLPKDLMGFEDCHSVMNFPPRKSNRPFITPIRAPYDPDHNSVTVNS